MYNKWSKINVFSVETLQKIKSFVEENVEKTKEDFMEIWLNGSSRGIKRGNTKILETKNRGELK